MFNFLKKKAVEAVLTVQTAVSTVTSERNYPAVVTEIHNEFYSAGDKILEEANRILSEANEKNHLKGKRLAALGFKQTTEPANAIKKQEVVELTQQEADIVRNYKKKYPFYKFITKAQVGLICEKYGLVCGPVDRFSGFVPERCLDEIERFSIKDIDKETTTWSIGIHPSYKDEKLNDDGVSAQRWSSLYKKEEITNPLQICAPKKDMGLIGLERYGYFYEKKKDVPDPVVLQPVKGGYLIVTAWGDEASDPLVVNEVNN